jgi:hypothetical protein
MGWESLVSRRGVRVYPDAEEQRCWNHGLLSVSTAALATSADDQLRGITVCRRSIASRCGQAISTRPKCHGGHLEDAISRGTNVPSGETSRVDARRVSRRDVRRWHVGKQRGRRLISIYTPIDDTSDYACRWIPTVDLCYSSLYVDQIKAGP